MATAIAAAMAAVAAAAFALPATGMVDLDQPDALAKVKRDHPEHLDKIRKILLEAPNQLPLAIPRWMRTEFNANDVGRVFLLKTSNPPKTRLSFTLDDVRYKATITLVNVRLDTIAPDEPARPIPAR